MKRKISYGCLIGSLVFVLLIGVSPAAEKLKVATSTKTSPWTYLPIFAAQEKGFWQENGIDAQWVPFRSGGASIRAMAAGAINVLLSSSVSAFRGRSRGVPLIFVAQIRSRNDFSVYVRGDSPRKRPGDLKGSKIGVSRKGGSEHAYARSVTRALGLEKEVGFVSTGGIVESIASLRTGTIDAVVLTPAQMLNLMLAGEVRILVNVDDYTAKPWTSNVMSVRIPFIKEKPDTVRRAVKSIVKGIDYTMSNPAWAKAKMKAIGGYDDRGVDYMFSILTLTKGGKINPEGLANVRKFLITFGIFGKKKPPRLNEIYTSMFLD